MSNEVFSFPRFRKYFRYDITQLWRNNGKAVLMLGGISLIVYIIWVIFSLLITGTWQAPTLPARIVVFFVGWIILLFYQTRTYGYLTEKRAGSSWLMVPASTLEKFVSMLIISIILEPLAYTASYLLVDGIIALADPTAGQAIIASTGEVMPELREGLAKAAENGVTFRLWMLAIPFVLEMMANIMYFLLCGICFKKWKLMGAFAVLMGISMLSVAFFSFFAWGDWVQRLEMFHDMDDPVAIVSYVNSAMSLGTLVNFVVAVLLGAGIYYRLKTIKH